MAFDIHERVFHDIMHDTKEVMLYIRWSCLIDDPLYEQPYWDNRQMQFNYILTNEAIRDSVEIERYHNEDAERRLNDKFYDEIRKDTYDKTDADGTRPVTILEIKSLGSVSESV